MSEEEGNLTDDVASTLESAGISMCCHNSYLVKDRKQNICERHTSSTLLHYAAQIIKKPETEIGV